MNTISFLDALHTLRLTTASQRTARLLGISVRHCQRIAAGAPVPKPVELLLLMYLVHGLPARASVAA